MSNDWIITSTTMTEIHGQPPRRESRTYTLTGSVLTAIMPQLPLALANSFAPFAQQSFRLYGINTLDSLSAFFGNTAVESAQWTEMEENLNYRAGELMKNWPKPVFGIHRRSLCASP